MKYTVMKFEQHKLTFYLRDVFTSFNWTRFVIPKGSLRQGTYEVAEEQIVSCILSEKRRIILRLEKKTKVVEIW